MKYKITVLKDLPQLKAGTVIECLGDDPTYPDENYNIVLPGTTRIIHCSKTLLDNAEFFSKTIDHDALSDLVCSCGSTKGVFHTESYYCRDDDLDNYGVNYRIDFECVCGKTRTLIQRGYFD